MLLNALFGCAGEDPPAEPPCPDTAGIVCRVAGTGDLGFNGDGLAARDTWFYFPSAILRHPDGRLIVVDFNNMRIRALEADGTVSTVAGNGDHAWSTPGAQAMETALENPVDAVWETDGTAWLLPLHEARVLRLAADGSVAPAVGTGDLGYAGDGGPAEAAQLSEAAGLALGEDGALYVADTQNNAIRRVRDGVIDTLAGAAQAGFVDGNAGDARFSGPQHLAVGGGELYVADANNHAVRAVDLGTGAVRTVAGRGARGYDGDGGPATAAALAYPYAVAVDAEGTLWIADSGNNVIRRVRDGAIETIAGTGTAGLSEDDGPAAEAQFSFPAHLLLEESDLYVADFGNGAIRLLRLEP